MYNPQQPDYNTYKEAAVAMQVATATPHQLVLILFDRLMEELGCAKGHIIEKRYERKAHSIK